jgi:NAD(P)H-hydrate epimerase
MVVLTREQVRRVDRLAIERLGIPGVVLMENAGRAVAEQVLRIEAGAVQRDPRSVSVVVLCGGGNNGGDGYVAARHLHNADIAVTIFAASDPAKLSGDAAAHYAIAAKMGLPCRRVLDEEQLEAALPELTAANVFVDALLGTGFKGELRPHLAALIRRCNALTLENRRMVAVDVPSGLDCDTGAPSQATVRADVTVTFVAPKRGFVTERAKPFLGRIVVASIGTPPSLTEEVLAQA